MLLSTAYYIVFKFKIQKTKFALFIINKLCINDNYTVIVDNDKNKWLWNQEQFYLINQT